MRLVIIESPFAGDVDANINYARRCVRDSLMRGEAPIASHLLYTQPGVLDDDKATAFAARLEETMTRGFDWTDGLPLAAEIETDWYYHK